MKFEFVSAPQIHWAMGQIEKRNMFRSEKQTPDWLVSYFDSWSLLPTNKAVICFDNFAIGVFRYNLYGEILSAEGTFVHPDHQHKGIASKMWIEALNHHNPQIIKVQLATTNGKRLINKIKKIYRHLNWEIKEYEDI